MVHQCRRSMQTSEDDDGPGNDIVEVAEGVFQGVIFDGRKLQGEEPEEREGFRLCPAQQKAQRYLYRQQGASFADWTDKPIRFGGLGLGTGPVSISLALVILMLLSFLMISGVDDPNQAQNIEAR